MWLPLGAVRPNSGQRAGAEVHCLTGTQTDISDKTREDRGVTVVIDEVPGFRNHPNGSGELRTAGGAQSWRLQLLSEASSQVRTPRLSRDTHTTLAPPTPKNTHTHEEQTVNWLAWTQGKYYTEQLLHVTSYCTSVWMCVNVCECLCRWHSYLEI